MFLVAQGLSCEKLFCHYEEKTRSFVFFLTLQDGLMHPKLAHVKPSINHENTRMYRPPILFICIASTWSCSTPATSTSGHSDTDTLHVVASRLFESRTYEDFLEPLARPAVIQWHNASELSDSALQVVLGIADGVLMTGGADIHPERYGHAADTVRCGAIDMERDRVESELLRAVDSLHLPCLGVCRGLQFMNVHNGGTLHAHLPDVLGTDAHRAGVQGNSRDTLHVVDADAGFMGAGPAVSSDVVSHHHQGINRLGEGLEVWAQAPDGLAEGIRRKDTIAYPCYVGVQWHPERSPAGQPLVEPVGGYFIGAMQLN